MTHRANTNAVAIRTDHIGRVDLLARVLISLLSVVIILGKPLSEGTAMG